LDNSAELTILRRRQADIAARANSIPDSQGGTLSGLFQVFNAGAMPSGGLKYYAAHPTYIGGSETEGAAPVINAGSAQVNIAVLGSTPSVGDVLVARRTGGRWVAERGSGTSPPPPPPFCPCSRWGAGTAPGLLFLSGEVSSDGFTYCPYSLTLSCGGNCEWVGGNAAPAPCFAGVSFIWTITYIGSSQWTVGESRGFAMTIAGPGTAPVNLSFPGPFFNGLSYFYRNILVTS
jgi:hypothetical protein